MTHNVPQHKQTEIPKTLAEANTLDALRHERIKAYSEYLLAKQRFQSEQKNL